MPSWGGGYTGGSTGGGGTSTGSGSGGGGTNWADWIALGLSAYQASKKPKIKNVPLSPEERELYRRYIMQLDNPAVKYNAGIASDLAKDQLTRMAPGLSFNRTNPFTLAFMGLTPPAASPVAGFDPMNPSTRPPTGQAYTDYLNDLIRRSSMNQAQWEQANKLQQLQATGATGTGMANQQPSPKYSASQYAGKGATYGSVLGPVGSAIGAALGWAFGTRKKRKQRDKDKKKAQQAQQQASPPPVTGWYNGAPYYGG